MLLVAKNLIFLVFLVIHCCLKIIVIAFNRPALLSDCLLHLNDSYYPRNFQISLEIRIDRFQNHSVADAVIDVANKFNWKYGSKEVYVHPTHQGLQGQWLSINPSCMTLIIEEDILVSPYWFAYVDPIISSHHNNESIFGISLQRAQWQLGINEHGKWRRLDKLEFDDPIAFTYPAPATWGIIVFPDRWSNFRKWTFEFLSNDRRKYTNGSITTKWIMDKGEMNLITPLMFEFLSLNDLTNVYFYFRNKTALSKTTLSISNDRRFSQYQHDKLVDFYLDLRVNEIPEYSPCFDLASAVKVQIEGDKAKVRRVLKHLRNVCRMQVLDGVSADAYKFDCFNGTTIPELSLRCPYRRGLYPDSS